MAEVKRYTASIMHPGVREDPEGLLVGYHHYAELKAEVERLRFIGDEIIMDVYRSECLTDKWCKMARKWDAAKEGKTK
jgi:hypothetical protein